MANIKSEDEEELTAEEIQEIEDEAQVSIRFGQAYLTDFDLSEAEFNEILRLIIRVKVKTDTIQQFYQTLSSSLKRPQAEIDKIAVAVAANRFWTLRQQLDGVEDLIKQLGGELPKASRPAENQKAKSQADAEAVAALAEYDWKKISGLERRAILEKLGVSQKQFKDWQAGIK